MILWIRLCRRNVVPSFHKIWLTQEADAKSWSSLKHVQPKEGRKELAPREIKFRCRRLDTTIRERAGSSQVPREAQESERYPGLFFFVSFFSSLLFLLRCSRQKSCAMEEREQTGVSHGSNREKGSPTISIRLFVDPTSLPTHYSQPESRPHGGATG